MDVTFFRFSFLGLLIVPAFLAVVIILLIKGGKVTRWVIGGLVVLLLLFGLFSFHAATPRIVHNVQPAVYETTPITEDPSLWQVHLEQEMVPEVYSGKEAAVLGLGMQLEETIQTATGGQLQKIIIAEIENEIDMGLLEKLRQGVQTAFPQIPVLINDPRLVSTEEDKAIVRLSFQNEQAGDLVIPELLSGSSTLVKRHLHDSKKAGTAQAVVETADGKFVKEVRYDYRPWMDRMMPDFTGSNPSWQPKVFRSFSIAMSQEEAVQQATEQARQYILQQMPNRPIASCSITLDDMRNHGLIVDEYTQKLQGLSGPIWRAALLLDVSPERLWPLQSRFVVQQQRVISSWAKLAFSLGGMIVLICLVYLVLNWVTKGYYSTRLTILAVMLVMILSGILLFLNRTGMGPFFGGHQRLF